MSAAGALSDSRSFRFPPQASVVGAQAHPTSLPRVCLTSSPLVITPSRWRPTALTVQPESTTPSAGSRVGGGGVRPVKVNVHARGRVRRPALFRSDLTRRMAEGLSGPHPIADLVPEALHAAAPQVEVVRRGSIVVLDLHARAAGAKHGGEGPVGGGAYPVRVAALARARIRIELAGARVEIRVAQSPAPRAWSSAARW